MTRADFSILLGLALVASFTVAAISESDTKPETASAASVTSSRASFQWPKLFDFENYKRQFHKHYGSLAENIVRNKIYLAKAFKVFIAAIKYRCRQMKYFLRINPRSDWTPRELMQGFLRLPGKLSSDKKETGQQAAQPADDTEVPEREEEVAEESADELNALLRQASVVGQRELPFDRLMSEPNGPSAKRSDDEFAPSNNPNYEPPNHRIGKSTEAEQKTGENEDAWTADAAAKYQLAGGVQLDERALGVLPGHNYVSSVVRSALKVLKSCFVGESADHAELPDVVYLDHRDSGCITTPRDQMGCQSCYIFAYVALYEWLYCELKGRQVNLSAQYIKDCGPLVGMKGCDTGDMAIVPFFVARYGLELETNYPYAESQETCPYEDSTDPAKMGYLRLETGDLLYAELQKLPKILKLTPLAIYLMTSSDFIEYGGGVHTNDECIESNKHAMLLIGHGREDGEEYWLIKNSHGVHFGENGYYKISKRVACFGENRGFFFLNSWTKTVSKKKNRNYDSEPMKRAHFRRLRKELQRQVEADEQATDDEIEGQSEASGQ